MPAGTSSNSQAPVVVWFRSDLRLRDHVALTAAVASGRPLVACYVFDEQVARGPGRASRWWLHGSLAALAGQIEARGGTLLLRRGRSAEQLLEIVAESGATQVHCGKSYEPEGRKAETQVSAALEPRGVRVITHGGALLFDPDQIRTKTGEPFKVFTAFWNACLRAEPPAPPRPVPSKLVFARVHCRTDILEDWQLRPAAPDWAQGLRERWSPGEEAAGARAAAFVAGPLERYSADRDRPDRAGSSRLSAHLHFGEMSPRDVWAAVRAADADSRPAEGGAAFLRELGWREFAQHLLWHWPDFPEESFRPKFRRFPWRDHAPALGRWQRGETGYPFVDAGMRELWHTGWMHNRVRMVAASFLVKHLLVPWQRGAEWFWDTLVDADLANNSVSWQWVAGSGADAAPYFRVFNPSLQGRKFDPDGSYVRRWLPELAAVPTRFIHEPGVAPAEVLRAARVDLGTTYPLPIVEHRAARARALAAYTTLNNRR